MPRGLELSSMSAPWAGVEYNQYHMLSTRLSRAPASGEAAAVIEVDEPEALLRLEGAGRQ